MKKLVIAVLAVLCVAPAAMAKDWGASVKLGFGQNDPKDMQRVYDGMPGNKEFDKMPAYLSLEVLHEWALNDEANKLGFKIGWDTYGENKIESKAFGGEFTENSDAFPFTVYYRRDNGVQNWGWFAGAGVTIMHSKWESDGWFGKDSASKNKVFPHLVAGVEYRFTEVFALGLDARYNFSAKVKKDNVLLSNRSGFGGALAARFYF